MSALTAGTHAAGATHKPIGISPIICEEDGVGRLGLASACMRKPSANSAGYQSCEGSG